MRFTTTLLTGLAITTLTTSTPVPTRDLELRTAEQTIAPKDKPTKDHHVIEEHIEERGGVDHGGWCQGPKHKNDGCPDPPKTTSTSSSIVVSTTMTPTTSENVEVSATTTSSTELESVASTSLVPVATVWAPASSPQTTTSPSSTQQPNIFPISTPSIVTITAFQNGAISTTTAAVFLPPVTLTSIYISILTSTETWMVPTEMTKTVTAFAVSSTPTAFVYTLNAPLITAASPTVTGHVYTGNGPMQKRSGEMETNEKSGAERTNGTSRVLGKTAGAIVQSLCSGYFLVLLSYTLYLIIFLTR